MVQYRNIVDVDLMQPTEKPTTTNTAGSTLITMTAKTEEIRRILSEPVVDLWKLRELALTEGGLVNGKVNHHRYLAFFDLHHTNRKGFIVFSSLPMQTHYANLHGQN